MAFDYTICGEYSIEKYRETVAFVEKNFPDFRAEKEIIEPLDGDMIRAVYVESSIAIILF